MKLYKHQAYLANYEKYGASRDLFDQCRENCLGIMDEYEQLENESGKEEPEIDLEDLSFYPIL